MREGASARPFSLQQDSREETIEKKEDSDMAVVFPNIDTEQFMWKKSSANEKKLDNELDKFLAKPHITWVH